MENIPKLGIIFPTLPGQAPLIAFPLALPMGWANIPSIFLLAVTETIANLVNKCLQSVAMSLFPHHNLDALAKSIPLYAPFTGPTIVLPPHVPHDPSMWLHQDQPLAYVDVFVNDLIGAMQNTSASLQPSHPHTAPLTNCQQVTHIPSLN